MFLSAGILARWELTCGFCKTRFRKIQPLAWDGSVCPACGTRNLLPVPRFPSDPGPRP
jgi:rRNA maturation endonuclease Nob1